MKDAVGDFELAELRFLIRMLEFVLRANILVEISLEEGRLRCVISICLNALKSKAYYSTGMILEK